MSLREKGRVLWETLIWAQAGSRTNGTDEKTAKTAKDGLHERFRK
jgi:hypothetical protein